MKIKHIKQSGKYHILTIISAILISLIVFAIKYLLNSDREIFNILFGIVISIVILILPFLKNYIQLGFIHISLDKLIFKLDSQTDSVEYFFSDNSFEYLKLRYTGFDGEHPVNALVFGGSFNQYSGVDNFIEISIGGKIISYEIYIKNHKEYKRLISYLQSINELENKVFLERLKK